MRAGHAKIMEHAAAIAQRFRECKGITLKSLMDEYHCGYRMIRRVLLSQIPREEYLILARRRLGRPNRGSFRKGVVPWNKGRKGWCPPGCRATQFQPGQIRGAAARKYRPLGTVTVRRDTDKCGTKPRTRWSRWIKVKDDGRPQDRWIPYARYVWEKEHQGPVPAGCFVGHADNNTLNDSPDNLILVRSRREHCLRLYRRPGVIAKCRARAAAAARRRHAENRTMKRWARQQVQRIPGWECRECGFETSERVNRCPKCGGSAVVPRNAPLQPELVKIDDLTVEA